MKFWQTWLCGWVELFDTLVCLITLGFYAPCITLGVMKFFMKMNGKKERRNAN